MSNHKRCIADQADKALDPRLRAQKMPRSKALNSDSGIGSSTASHSLGSRGGRHSNIQDSGLSVVYEPEHDEPTIEYVANLCTKTLRISPTDSVTSVTE